MLNTLVSVETTSAIVVSISPSDNITEDLFDSLILTVILQVSPVLLSRPRTVSFFSVVPTGNVKGARTHTVKK